MSKESKESPSKAKGIFEEEANDKEGAKRGKEEDDEAEPEHSTMITSWDTCSFIAIGSLSL